jgi:hypothetical protein
MITPLTPGSREKKTRETAVVTDRVSRKVCLSCFVLLVLSLVSACEYPGFNPTCEYFESIPITPLGSQASQPKFETVGAIIAIHGSGSAKVNSGSSVKAIKVEQSVPLPAYANQATVFLNGWSANYIGSDVDHHVRVLASAIGKIRRSVDPRTREPILTWNAIGVLRDNDGKEGYELNYYFTVLAWNDSSISAAVDHGTVDANNKYCTPDGEISDNFYASFNIGFHSALSSFSSFIQNNIFAGTKAIAILPRGFGFAYPTTDHHILQVAYNLDHSEAFVSEKKKYNIRTDVKNAPVPSGASVAGSGFVSWDSYAILKDRKTRKDYIFGEVVSAIGGNDVGVIQPPYSIVPAEDHGFVNPWCASLGANYPVEEDVVIDNISFEYAIPMLTGWDLEFNCNDQHVKAIGVWIGDWSYQPPVGGVGGTLRYKLLSQLRDKNDRPTGYAYSHKVTILGLRPLGTGGPIGRAGGGPQRSD